MATDEARTYPVRKLLAEVWDCLAILVQLGCLIIAAMEIHRGHTELATQSFIVYLVLAETRKKSK